ncbi:glycosyltransferase [uncultured Kordia sp.]|uniref:nucleotide disphospho-sugar-binding domain-containing protein n=1 Tax=uncultured Kordia sp. TaxID=507699 RepID=UPI0026357E83|nr:glycosyltransferase [uncultured Kordia sp.]
MANICFIIFNQPSHYNATFAIARALETKGHSITYLSHNESQKAYVEKQGFKLNRIFKECYYKHEGQTVADENDYRRPLAILKEVIAQTKELKKIFIEGTEAQQLIDREQPDLFIIDYSYVQYYFNLQKFGIPIVMLETTVSSVRTPKYPGVFSTLMPEDTFLGNLKISLNWNTYYFKRWLLNTWYKILFRGYDPNSIIKMMIKKAGIPKNKIDRSRAFYVGIKGVKELVLCEKEFDFPGRNIPDQYHLCPIIDQQRTGTFIKVDQTEEINTSEVLNALENTPNIIYSSLGSSASLWFHDRTTFFKRLIDAVRSLSDTILILSVGKNFDQKSLGTIPAHVYIYERVPQLEVLKKVKLMVTHGGLNSVNECIFNGVPMLVDTLGLPYDQNGNAARVAYHGMGLRANIRKEATTELSKKIQQILNDSSFKENILKMQKVYINAQDATKHALVVEQFLDTTHTN